MPQFEPSYRLCQQFVINEVQSVMAVDGYTNSHPINQPVHHPDEINQIFDRISYNKGYRHLQVNILLTNQLN